jgi:hypothetical protein
MMHVMVTDLIATCYVCCVRITVLLVHWPTEPEYCALSQLIMTDPPQSVIKAKHAYVKCAVQH